LFGWHFDIVPSGYGFVAREEAGVAVGVGKAEDGSAGWVTAYINVPDITATLARVTELGGQIVAPRFSPAPGAVLGLFTDPEGHLVGLTEVLSRRTGLVHPARRDRGGGRTELGRPSARCPRCRDEGAEERPLRGSGGRFLRRLSR
jgi:predicted enzyme related to lactoylglutathione lyase